ncbi:hypothetical protein F4860DRAFT_235287 [Xylaria cubensis]|nr:hypothetical protein F4860DRAFT_235287 [Xylaria cubensis]
MLSTHSFLCLPKPRTRRQENALVASFLPMIRILANGNQLVLELSPSFQITHSDSCPITITTTNYNKFIPLPSDDYEMLKKAVPPTSIRYTLQEPFRSPGFTNYSLWASRITAACRSLTKAKDKLETGIECVGYSEEDTGLSTSVLLTIFRNGESARSVCGVPWNVTAILTSMTSLDHGAILKSNTVNVEELKLGPNRILRSELLTLLALLRVACRRAVRDGASSTDPTVFVLSFTCNTVRVLQARLTDANKISVSIPQTFDTQVQSFEEREKLFKELVCWTMFKDRNLKCRTPSGSTIRSAASDSSTATAKTTSSYSNRSVSTNASSIEPNDENDEDYKEGK